MRSDGTSAHGRLLGALVLGVTVGLVGRPAGAVDPFEIQVYDGSLNDPGQAGLEIHVNSVVSGVRAAPPPELPPHHQTHVTAEPSFGITRFWELGAYIQSTLRGDGNYDFAGAKLRSKLVWAKSERVRLGLNAEISRQPVAYDANRWGGELRPIVRWGGSNDRLQVAVNPILDFSLAGAVGAPSFEPAFSVVYVWPNAVSVGVEYYAALGPITGFDPVREQQHYVYEVVNILTWSRIELNLGVGQGLTPASNDLVAKIIFGIQR